MSLNSARCDLVRHGSVLATRPKGRKAGAEAAESLSSSGRLLLNFHGVEVASPPFLDEVLKAVRAELLSGEKRWLLVTGCNEDVQESLEMVLQRHKMALGSLDGSQVELLGGTPQLKETLRAAQEMQEFTAPDLAEHLRLKLPALHQRLNALLEAGVLAKQNDPTATRGKRGMYRTPPEDEVAAASDESDRPQVIEVAR